jgi:hypothetical protein
MNIKDRIADNSYTKILAIHPNTKTQYILKLRGKKCAKISLSKHKTKAGRLLALFCRVKYAKEKLCIH